MDSTPSSKLAVVTGASSGIGLELARRFARDGFDLVIAADDGGIHSAAQELERAGAQVEPMQVDLRILRPFLERAGIVPNEPPLETVLPLIHERLKRLSEAPELLKFFFQAPATPGQDGYISGGYHLLSHSVNNTYNHPLFGVTIDPPSSNQTTVLLSPTPQPVVSPATRRRP